MSLGAIHLIAGNTGSAAGAWFTQAIAEHGALDSRLITIPGGARVWVHHGADVPASQVGHRVARLLRRSDVQAGTPYREIHFGARCTRTPPVAIPDYIPQDLLDGA